MKPSFSLMWTHYPQVAAPCDGGWENQCAIRMSMALTSGGLSLSDYGDPKCKHGHARGAESLANYLWRRLGRPTTAMGHLAFERMTQSKKGIVFFKDIAGFRGGLGDHIDLWDGRRTKTGEYAAGSKETWFWELS